jgi:hypothetical protein
MNSDNAFWQHGCPALMNDDRLFRSYVSSSRLNQFIMRSNNLKDEHEYRRFLVNNAEQLMNNERNALHEHIRCKFTPSAPVTLTETPMVVQTPAVEAPSAPPATVAPVAEAAAPPAAETTASPAAPEVAVTEGFSTRARQSQSRGCNANRGRWM